MERHEPRAVPAPWQLHREHNFDVYRDIAGLDEEAVATAIGEGLFG